MPRKPNWNPELEKNSRCRMKAEEKVVELMAGNWAERRVNRLASPVRGAHSDYQQAVDLLIRFAAGEERSVWLRLCQIRAQNLTAKYWDLIVFVAERLQQRRRMKGQDVTTTIAEFYNRAMPPLSFLKRKKP